MAHGQARCYFLCFKGKMEPLKVKSHMIKHIIDEREDCHEVAVFKNR